MIELGLNPETGRLYAVPVDVSAYNEFIDGIIAVGRLRVPTSMEDIAKKVALGYAEHRDREARLSEMDK